MDYKASSQDVIPVVIIGAGISGIALGAQLRSKLDLAARDIRIFERQSGIGGTWHINRYPGVACDIPAIFYSYSFAPNPNWTSLHPSGKEIVTYLRQTADDYGISECVECDVDVAGCEWDEVQHLWIVRLKYMKPGMGDLSRKERLQLIERDGVHTVIEREEVLKARIVCSCVGGLVEPKGWPDEIKGIEKFQGHVFHSARWNYDVDLENKNVVVLGTGCSAAQFVPKLAKEYNAKSVTQLMRSPPWVVPRINEPGGEEVWKKWAPLLFKYVPGLMKSGRFAIFAGAELQSAMFTDSESAAAARVKYQAHLLNYMRKTAPENYHKILTPDHVVGCKRRVFEREWLSSLGDPRIDLTTMPLHSVNERSVVLGPGSAYPKPSDPASEEALAVKEIPADVIVLANGFDTTTWLHPLQVTGRDGVDLVTEMDRRGGPQAYQGTAMDGFPNFFMIFGPNTATGHTSVILASENMIIYALKFIKLVLNGEADTVEVTREAEVKYATDCQETLRKTVFSSGCVSWYVNDGWNSTVYPWSQLYFIYSSYFPRWSDWNIAYTRKGIWLRRTRLCIRAALLTASVALAYRLQGTSLTSTMVWLRETREACREAAIYAIQSVRRLSGY